MKKGDKYVIEIAEVHTHYDDNGKAFPLARIKGFSTLTFDQKGLDRLEKIEDSKTLKEKKPLNCRFIVTENQDCNDRNFSVGHIYTVCDGYITSDRGSVFPISNALHDFSELEKYFSGDGVGIYYSRKRISVLKVAE